MAKRFADTKLHRKAWFRKLPLALRETWRILCAECDEIGVWEIDLESLNFTLGLDEGDPDWVDLESIRRAFDVQIIEDDKLFIPGFVAFQYGDESGEVSHKNKILPKLVRMLKARGLPMPVFKDEPIHHNPKNDPPPIPHPTPIDGVKEEVEVKEEEKEKVVRGEFEGRTGPSASARQEAHMRFDFQALFEIYPRCQKRTQALRLMADGVGSPDAYRTLENQIRAYRAHVEREGTPFSKQLTFPNFWLERDDWSDSRTGTTNVVAVVPPEEESFADYLARKERGDA